MPRSAIGAGGTPRRSRPGGLALPPLGDTYNRPFRRAAMKTSTHTAIIYSVGQTHRIYIDVAPEEAARRWQLVRDGASEYELELERRHGYKVQRNEFQFTDEIEIWGNAGEEFRQITSMLMDDIASRLRD